MLDIARECGISISAVSHALRGGNGEVSEATRKRVITVAEEMGYDLSHNLSARRMALQRHGTLLRNQSVGFAMTESFHEAVYYLRILGGVVDAVAESSYGLHLNTTDVEYLPLPAVLSSGEVDGLLMLKGPIWSALYAERVRAEPNFGDRPIVSLIDPVRGCSTVHADDFTAGYQAASHLLDLGHRGIVHDFDAPISSAIPGVMVPHTDAVSRRLQGVCQACRDRGLDPDRALVRSHVPHLDVEIDTYGPQLVELLKSSPAITALIAPNDFAAVRIWRTLMRAGIRIPEDISLISFDDTDPIYSLSGDNMLTTIRLPLREIGREAAKLLIRTIDGDVQNLQDVVLPTELVVRESTTPPRSAR